MERSKHTIPIHTLNQRYSSIDDELSTWKGKTILTNDPSFTAWGWAITNVHGKVLEVGCIKTAPEHKKQRIRKSDDTGRRIVEIIQQLLSIISKWNVQYLLSESPHGSQNANAAVMIGVVSGIMYAISECKGIPLETYSEQDAKKAVLGKRAATKDEMITAIDEVYIVPWKKIKYADEAIADALAIHYVAGKQSQVLKYMQR